MRTNCLEYSSGSIARRTTKARASGSPSCSASFTVTAGPSGLMPWKAAERRSLSHWRGTQQDERKLTVGLRAARLSEADLDPVAWLLAQKPWIVPIPGTTKLYRLDEKDRK